MPIPPDLHDYLSKAENRQMTLAEGEIRRLSFFAPEQLALRKFIVDSFDLHLNGPLETDPEEQREFEGYSLVRECDNYSAEGVLVWFPEFKAYGAADPDHQRIIIYPGVTWADIAREPTWYINGQWYPDRVRHEEVNPWL